MALFKAHSAAVYGIDADLIDVEVDMYPSATARDCITVGMPDTAVRESRERIKSALIVERCRLRSVGAIRVFRIWCCRSITLPKPPG